MALTYSYRATPVVKGYLAEEVDLCIYEVTDVFIRITKYVYPPTKASLRVQQLDARQYDGRSFAKLKKTHDEHGGGIS